MISKGLDPRHLGAAIDSQIGNLGEPAAAGGEDWSHVPLDDWETFDLARAQRAVKHGPYNLGCPSCLQRVESEIAAELNARKDSPVNIIPFPGRDCSRCDELADLHDPWTEDAPEDLEDGEEGA